MMGNYTLANCSNFPVTLGGTHYIHGAPIMTYTGFVNVANDAGQFYSVKISTGALTAAASICSGATCNSTVDQVWSAAYIDSFDNSYNGYEYFAVANKAIQVAGITDSSDTTYGCTTTGSSTCGDSGTLPCCTVSKSSAVDTSSVLRNPTAAVPDYQGGAGGAVALYVTYRQRLYQLDPSSLALQTVTSAGSGLILHGTLNTRGKAMNTESATQHNWGTGASQFSCPFSSAEPTGVDSGSAGHYLVYTGDCDGYLSLHDSTGLNNLTADSSDNSWTGGNGNDCTGSPCVDVSGTVVCNVLDSAFLPPGSQGLYWTCGLSSGGENSGGGSTLIQYPGYHTNQAF